MREGAARHGEVPILIVEDNPDDFEACAFALTEDGTFANPIVRCETGEEALRYLGHAGLEAAPGNARPGVIFLDLNLPGLDGRDVLARLKRDPQTTALPVVVMSGSADPGDIHRCYEAGANSYLVKPGDLDGLTEVIQRVRDYWFGLVALPGN
ncbi:response regulator [Sagittula sp. S175]|uniref:response regulator n=1 Tax=Sagittula sp. S175 TaxID=3415129 RepID=UPI003C7AC6C0